MASSLYKAQSALRMCEEHDNKELTSFCRTCNIPICTQCVKSKHVHHDWDPIPTVAKERRARLPELCRRMKSEHLRNIRQNLYDAESEDEDQNTQKITAQKEALIRRINILADKKLEESKKRRHIGREGRKKAEKSLDCLERMTTELDENVGTFSDFDVLEMEQEMKKEFEDLLSLDIGNTRDKMIFVPGEVDQDLLENMIGHKHDPSVIEIDKINSFQMADLRCYGICGGKRNQAWVSNEDGNEISLVNVEGKINKKLKLKQYYFVVTENADIIYTDMENKTVNMLTDTRKMTDGLMRILYKTAPLNPVSISITKERNILVTLRDDGELYQLTSKSRRLVQKLNVDGDVLQTYEFADDGKTRLFRRPTKSVQNEDKDVFVVNFFSDSAGEIVALRSDGKVRFKYQGLTDSETFLPTAVECASDRRIFVASFTDQSVHVLAYDGTFIKYLLRGLNSEPSALSLHGDKLWLTCFDNTVHVYSLTAGAMSR